jgi:arginine deiminase
MISFNICSEVDKLNAVILHSPGPEVEDMTPATAQRALYSDILNLSVASVEYEQLKKILCRTSKVYEVKDLLESILDNNEANFSIIKELSDNAGNPDMIDQLSRLSKIELRDHIIEGIHSVQNSLTGFLDKEKYAVSPLHNMFFTRDTSFVIGNTVFIGLMAKQIREPETILMKNLYKFHPLFSGQLVTLEQKPGEIKEKPYVEGGDILVFSKEILIIGIGSRTNAAGVDFLIKKILEKQDIKYVIVQELPDKPESFIHLDMVFTLLSHDECLIYEPLILGPSKYHKVLISIENKSISKIEYVDDILSGLKKIGKDLKPISCGGVSQILQDREQWHSGCNLFAIDKGKVISYSRNVNTSETLNKNGYEVHTARDVLSKDIDLNAKRKILVTIDGSELSRGGGGARCMTMPLNRG